MNIGNRIRKARKNRKWTLENLKDKTGMSISFLSDIERGVSNPSLKRLKEIATALEVSASYLLGEIDSPTAQKKPIIIPEIYTIKAEKEMLAEDNFKDYHFVEREQVKNGTHFFIEVKDDSMAGSGILKGSLVLVKKQTEIENGKIAAIIFKDKDQEKFALRKTYKSNGQLLLQPDNTGYDTAMLPREEVTIIGKVISSIYNFN